MTDTERYFAYLARRRRQRIVAFAVGCTAAVVGIWWLTRASREQWLRSAPLAVLRQSARERPNDDEVAQMLCYRLLDDGQSSEALPIARRLVQRNPHSAMYWFGLGRTSAICGHPIEAIAAYRRAAEVDPKLGAARTAIGQIYGSAGLKTDALTEYDAGLKADANAPIDLSIWAACMVAKGRNAEAWKAITTSIAGNPMQDPLYPLLGQLAVRLHTEAKAKELMYWRLSQTRMYPVGLVRVALSRMLLAGPHDQATLLEAEGLCRTAIGDRAAPHFAVLAQVLALRGDLAGAREAAEEGLQVDPANQECLQELASACARLGDARQAARTRARIAQLSARDAPLRSYREATAAHPSDRAPRLRLAAALDQFGRHAEAAEECYEVLRVHPGDPEAAALLARARTKAVEKLAPSEAREPSLPFTM